MDENLLSLLEELSLRTSCSEDENYYPSKHHNGNNYLSSNYASSSNVSSPNQEQLASNLPEEDLELKNAVNSLFHDLSPTNARATQTLDQTKQQQEVSYDKSKLLVALLGNIDLVTCAVKKINQLISLGKRMEQIYRCYYVDPNVQLDLNEIDQLIARFSNIYNSESYVREVNVSRVYQAYCRKLVHIYRQRTDQASEDERMIF